MNNLHITKDIVDIIVTQFKENIQTEIIDASETSGNLIFNTIENSSGEFINSLKDVVKEEILVLSAIGGFLTDTADYIQAAASAFFDVDAEYNSSKLK